MKANGSWACLDCAWTDKPQPYPGLSYKTVQLIWSHDLNNYIEEKLSRPWSLGQNDSDCGQDSLLFFEVWPDPEATAIVQAWLDSPPAQCPGRLNQPGFGESVDIYTEDILKELCNRELLYEGDLNVHVWW